MVLNPVSFSLTIALSSFSRIARRSFFVLEFVVKGDVKRRYRADRLIKPFGFLSVALAIFTRALRLVFFYGCDGCDGF